VEEKELKSLMEGMADKQKQAIKTEVEAATAGLMTTKDLEAKFEAIGLKDNVIKSLTEAVEKQGVEMRKLLGGEEGEKKGLDQLIKEKSEQIVKLASGGQNVKFEVNKTAIARASVSGSTMAMRLPDVGEIPYLGTVMSGLFRHAPVSASSNGVIRYYDQNAITRNAASVAEAATKPESAITWVERTLTLEKVADSIPVSKEAWKDVYFIQSEIDRLLNVNLSLKVDELLYDGDGNTPNIKGVYTSATAFDGSASPYADAVDNANIYDLIAATAVNISNNKQSKYSPNVVLLNPVDIWKYKVLKATDGHYILPPFVTSDGMNIAGMRVIETSQVTANTMLVGDFRFGTIYDLEGINVEMGWVNDQFIKNSMTILAEQRLGLLIRTVNEGAFNKVTSISAAIANLETP
jgi:hypothetical protein